MTVQLPEASAADSAVQRAAETEVLALLSIALGVDLAPQRICLADKVGVEIDAASDDPRVIAEIWADHGAPKSAQRNKVLTDALKLRYVKAVKGRGYRKIVCFDEAAAKPFRGQSRYGRALDHHGIEIVVALRGPSIRRSVSHARSNLGRPQSTHVAGEPLVLIAWAHAAGRLATDYGEVGPLMP